MRLRRSRITAAATVAFALVLTACGGNGDTTDETTDDSTAEETDDAGADDAGADDAGDAADGDEPEAAGGDLGTLVVGVSPVPHGDILGYVRDELAPDIGLEIEVVEFTDYIQPNVALHEGDLDANYFQHIPYLTQQLADNPDYDFTPLSPVHIEPLALYSEELTDVSELPEGGQVAVPNDPANLGRSLWLLEDAGVITVADTGEELPTEQDVDDNPLNLTFVPVEAANLPNSLPDVAAAVINGNYALEAGLSPAEDGLAVESPDDNPYANLLTARTGEEADERIVALDELLTSDEVRAFIEETYTDGTVIPAS